MKYSVFLLFITGTLLLQSNFGFCSEERVVRLIDLSPKEETLYTGSELNSTNSGRIENLKTREKKNQTDKIVKEEKENDKLDIQNEEDTTISPPKEEKDSVQGLINSYILETYKAQGDRILKDMDISLQKKIPDIEKRMQAYSSIQKTLELRKTRIMKVSISDVNKTLLNTYFEYMIEALEKKKESLKE